MRTATVEKLEKLYEKDAKRPKNQKFSNWVDELLSNYADYHNKLEEYGPFIDYVGPGDSYINLYDHNLGRSVTITIDSRGKERKLHCDVDDDNDCVHVGFCFGHKEIYPLLIDKGIRPPTKKVKR